MLFVTYLAWLDRQCSDVSQPKLNWKPELSALGEASMKKRSMFRTIVSLRRHHGSAIEPVSSCRSFDVRKGKLS